MHTPPKIIGYMAVENPLRDGHAYRGTERNPWWGLVLPYWEGQLTKTMTSILKPIMIFQNLSGLEICTDFSVLAQLNLAESCPGSEVIGLWSPLLTCVREPDIVPDAIFLGFEVKIVGEFSLILSGMHSEASGLASLLSLLNKNGLFDDVDVARAYARAYQQAAESGFAEKTSTDYEIISVYHVCNGLTSDIDNVRREK